ncbi:MAG: patatin-like phospholipase family protein [Clostridia bacterium]|nr:patatin-like phospholipase family protein [Clostridia bacterium]
MGFFSWLFKRKPRVVKLGLALGSGGAKGFAELGAIQAFEENGIQFDIIAGSSIGSIIGAFYADGYSSSEIIELIKKVDLREVTNFLMIKMDTAKMFGVIDKIIGSKNIEDLEKPFRAIATEYQTGEEFVFEKGSVAKALCASSSYPPFFKPVDIEGKQYVDGGFTNSVPCDVVKNLGAEYVVGIDLSNHEPKPINFLSRIFSGYDKGKDKPWEKGYENANMMLHPDLHLYKPTSVNATSEMFKIGYECALENIPKIKEEIEKLKKTKPKKIKKEKIKKQK